MTMQFQVVNEGIEEKFIIVMNTFLNNKWTIANSFYVDGKHIAYLVRRLQ